MIRRFFLMIITLGLLVVPCMGLSSATGEYVDKIAAAEVNWTQGTITTVGVDNPSQKTDNDSRDRQRALSDAVTNAHDSLLEVVKSIRIDTRISIGEFSATDSRTMGKIQDLIKSAQIVRQEYLSDGTVKVILQMSLYGGFSQLILPMDIKQVESIKTVKESSPSPPEDEKTPGEDPTPPEEIYSGLIIDARGLDLNPALVPTIRDKDGREIYGAAFISREFAVQGGVASYMREMGTAVQHPKVSPNPLVVKGLKTEGVGKSDIIISTSNASKIFGSSEHLSLLRSCKVIIVAD